MPSGLIEHQNRVARIDGRADFGQGAAIAGVHQGMTSGALALRADRAEDVRPFRSLVMRGAGRVPRLAQRRGARVLLPHASFVFETNSYLGSVRGTAEKPASTRHVPHDSPGVDGFRGVAACAERTR